MPQRPLIIDVDSNCVPGGNLNQWDVLPNASKFIANILTPKLNKNTNIGSLVSGIPTAFARVDLFTGAIKFCGSGSKPVANNLTSYFPILVDEWRGFIACLALDYPKISVRRINLAYSDGRSVEDTANLYEPKGAFGNMLLGRRDLWCDLTVPAANRVPFLNVIKYNGQVVGATAPDCLLFTSTGYQCDPAQDKPWISSVNGRFTDPLKNTMTEEQVATLHAYVSYLINGLNKFQAYYQAYTTQLQFTPISKELGRWRDEIVALANTKNFDLLIGSIPPVAAGFEGPFSELFCYTEYLYADNGFISDKPFPGAIRFDPRRILLDESSKIARIHIKVNEMPPADLPILLLQANVVGSADKAFFALPLSALGLNVFGDNLNALVYGGNNNISATIQATYNPAAREKNLEVVLTINIGTRQRQFKRIYTVGSTISNQDILIWPNFMSQQWNAYYMFNELPHNNTSLPYRAFPFVADFNANNRIMLDANNHPLLLSDNGRIVAPQQRVKAELLVEDTNLVAGNAYKYEIYRSNLPFKGVALMSPTGEQGGYLVVNYSPNTNSPLPLDMTIQGFRNLTPVRLGVDFGSTNTSIAYSSDNTGEKGFDFVCQRVSLIGIGRPNVPRENDVLFFQGPGQVVHSNSVKSVLTLHDPRRLPQIGNGQSTYIRDSKEVVGGMPCFAENLPFAASDAASITLDYPTAKTVTQVHNMKWVDNDTDIAHKKAFLRTLLLQVYSNLFMQGLVPTSLKWSFPSAMPGSLLISYQQIWSDLNDVCPVFDQQNTTSVYALSISKYSPKGITAVPGGNGGLGNAGGGFGNAGGGFGNAGGGFGNAGGGFGNAGGGFGDAGRGFGNAGGGFGDAGGGFGNAGSGFGNAGGGFGNAGGGFGNVGGGFGNAGDGFGNAGDGFGNAGDGFGNPQQPTCDFMPDDTEASVTYSPKLIYNPGTANNPSLSEAEAVANFTSVRYAKEANVLNICFDVGGSTSDITALFMLNGQDVTMIKQNSIRFAAERVANSVASFPEFKLVLQNVCSQFNIRMVGLNMGKETYSSQTAPYFFNQIVNRLSSNQLSTFYAQIAAKCPKLMCVNMYMTGLLMYYAGELSRKLIADLNRTSDQEWPGRQKPRVRVSFAGKGSRLFQWLAAINPNSAQDYYLGMFDRGYGEEVYKELSDRAVMLPNANDPDIKFEVSKGLAKGNTALYQPASEQPSEIFGENGYRLMGLDNVHREVTFTNSIVPDMLRQIGVRVTPNQDNPAPKFFEFCSFFYLEAKQLLNWHPNESAMANACRQLQVVRYIQNMPEFRSALIQNPFDFVAPIIFLEGMQFYDETLIKLL